MHDLNYQISRHSRAIVLSAQATTSKQRNCSWWLIDRGVLADATQKIQIQRDEFITTPLPLSASPLSSLLSFVSFIIDSLSLCPLLTISGNPIYVRQTLSYALFSLLYFILSFFETRRRDLYVESLNQNTVWCNFHSTIFSESIKAGDVEVERKIYRLINIEFMASWKWNHVEATLSDKKSWDCVVADRPIGECLLVAEYEISKGMQGRMLEIFQNIFLVWKLTRNLMLFMLSRIKCSN